MTIRINDSRRPIGAYTWVAHFRDNAILQEFLSEQNEDGEWVDYPQISFDVVAARDDVAQIHLIPIDQAPRPYIRIDVAEGERVVKKWVRSPTINLDTGEDGELPPIDCFLLISEKPVWHYSYLDGSLLITTNTEP